MLHKEYTYEPWFCSFFLSKITGRKLVWFFPVNLFDHFDCVIRYKMFLREKWPRRGQVSGAKNEKMFFFKKYILWSMKCHRFCRSRWPMNGQHPASKARGHWLTQPILHLYAVLIFFMTGPLFGIIAAKLFWNRICSCYFLAKKILFSKVSEFWCWVFFC